MEKNYPILDTPDHIITIDHEEIRQWVEKIGGKPAVADDPMARGDKPLIRIDFPGKADESMLQEAVENIDVSWDKFFEIFEKEKLAFVYQEKPRSEDKTLWFMFIKRKEFAD